MKYKLIIVSVLLVLLLFGCSTVVEEAESNDVVSEDNGVAVEDDKGTEPVDDEPVEAELKEDTCEDKVKVLIPAVFELTIASSRDADSEGWGFESEITWTDGVAMDTKGDIDFRKGTKVGENANYWYTTNTQNEKLFGEGGLKYYKKFIDDDGLTSKIEFIIKPILKPFNIIEPTEPFEPYRGTFEVVEYGFVECDYI